MIGPMEAQVAYDSGPLWSALAEAADILERNPEEAERRALATLELAPGQSQALQIIVCAKRAQGDIAGARAVLEGMAAELPGLAAIHYELGVLLAEMGEHRAAIGALRRVVDLEPKHPQAWRALGDALVQSGKTQEAANAYAQQFASSIQDLKMLEQLNALSPEHAEAAEDMLREYLSICSTDPLALQMLGQMYMRATQFESAESVFKRALDIVPTFRSVRLDYISALRQQLKYEEENKQLDVLLEDEPDNLEFRCLKAVALSTSGQAEEGVQYGHELVCSKPDEPKVWLAYAQTLRVVGRPKDCIAAFRKALELEPRLGEAWWALSNLKTFRFDPPDVHAMRAELARSDTTEENREFLHFALGKALEDLSEHQEAFQQYSQGNALIRARYPYDIEDVSKAVAHEKRRFTREFFAARGSDGCPSSDPIFIVGLPRSGSTLVEQILASHSAVEGLGELPSFTAVLRKLQAERPDGESELDPAVLDRGALQALGAEYLERCRGYRKLERPYFTDKMPSNFHHLGFICIALPNAKIIDVRRHPLACCFSNFKQIFPFRQGPSYDLCDIGRYYRAYVELMAHFDRVLPGRIHRVIYEDLVRDPEAEIHRLLNYCGLPFEEASLRFYETNRGIRTISSEQVRRPMYTDSVGQWRHFEPWLGPLKAALGPVLESYPAAPDVF